MNDPKNEKQEPETVGSALNEGLGDGTAPECERRRADDIADRLLRVGAKSFEDVYRVQSEALERITKERDKYKSALERIVISEYTPMYDFPANIARKALSA